MTFKISWVRAIKDDSSNIKENEKIEGDIEDFVANSTWGINIKHTIIEQYI